MGAHVWGPAYLRDHLLPHGQVAGWTGDWYAGFPAYQFYMVLPSLLIVLLNAGLHGAAGVRPRRPRASSALGAAATFWSQRRRRNLALAGAVVGVRPGRAAVRRGVQAGDGQRRGRRCRLRPTPSAAWRAPASRRPAVLAVATLPFLFYRGFTIYGGNIPSTLAGEFAFSISLSLAAAVPRAWCSRASRPAATGRSPPCCWPSPGCATSSRPSGRIGATAVDRGGPVPAGRPRRLTRACRSGAAGCGCSRLAGLLLGAPVVAGRPGGGPAAAAVAASASGLWLRVGERALAHPGRWSSPACCRCGGSGRSTCGPTTSTTWGGRSSPTPTPRCPARRVAQHLLPYETPDVDLRWVFGLALVGRGAEHRPADAGRHLPLAHHGGRRRRLRGGARGPAVERPAAALLLPDHACSSRPWRVSELVRTIIDRWSRDGRPAAGRAPGVPVGARRRWPCVMVFVGAAARPAALRPSATENGYAWPRFSPWQLQAEPASFIPSWAKWNYTRLRGQGRLPRVPRHRAHAWARSGEQRGLRPGVLGVREGARPLRHARWR